MPDGARWTLALAAALAALPLPWPGTVHALLLVIAFGFAPGALASDALGPARNSAERTLQAVALSPLLVGGAMALLVWLRIGPAVAARALLAVIALAAFLPRRRAAVSGPTSAWAPALLWTALIAVLLAMSPALAPRADGWFHAAVTLQILERGLPPEDPFFAGLRLLYFWGSHVWAAAWLAVAPRLAVWTPWLMLNLAGALGAALGVGLLAERLGAGRRGAWLAVGLATLGYTPFAWLLVVLRSLVGDVVGRAELGPLLTRGIDPVLSALNPGTLHVSMVFFGDKFLVLTPLSLALAIFVAVVLAFLDTLERPHPRNAARLALLQAAAWFVHSVVGWATALAAAGWWLWTLLSPRRADRDARVALVAVLAAFGAAALLMLPYIVVTTLGKQQSLGIGLSREAIVTWLIGGAALVPPALVWLFLRARSSPPARALAVLAAALTSAGLLLGLPLGNQVKLFNALFLLLAAPAACGWLAWFDRLAKPAAAALATLLGVALLPTVALCVWGFASERGQTVMYWQRPSSAGEIQAMRWARAHTPAYAVFADPSVSLDMTVLAGRSTLWGGEEWAKNWGYPARALAIRRRTVSELARGTLSSESASFLDSLARPVLLVARRRPATGLGAAGIAGLGPHRFPPDPLPPGFRLVHRNDDVRLYRRDPSPMVARP